jgi:hypothetical protein
MSIDEAFRGARLKIKRADQHINDLYLESRTFHRSGVHEITVENNVKGSDSILRVNVTQDISEDVLLMVGDAVHNLRSALDYAMSDIEFDTTDARDPHTSFPIRDTLQGVVAACNGGLKKKASKAVLDFILNSVQPYQRGLGEPLRDLHTLDIEDKHRLLIAKKNVAVIRNIHCIDGRGERFTIDEWALRKDRATHIYCAGHSDVKVTHKGNASFGIVFGDGMPFYGQPILPTLRKLSHFVSRTIDSVERVFLATRTT